MAYDSIWDRIEEECGVFGIYDPDTSVPLSAYYGLFALQHRGQESAGITVADGQTMTTQADMGLVTEVFRDLPADNGKIAIGHVRYSTTGASIKENVQPLQVETDLGPVAIAHNGNLVNARLLREKQIKLGTTFRTTMDTEVIINLLARSEGGDVTERLQDVCQQIDGAYCLVVATATELYGCAIRKAIVHCASARRIQAGFWRRKPARWIRSARNSSATSRRDKSCASPRTVRISALWSRRKASVGKRAAHLNTCISRVPIPFWTGKACTMRVSTWAPGYGKNPVSPVISS